MPVDVFFSVDPQSDTLRHFSGAGDEKALLIALPTMDASSLQRYSGDKMCVLQKANTVTSTIEEFLPQKGYTFSGGSVSCIGLDLMIQLGCNPIIFVGMDYSFPGNKFYSNSTVEMKQWHNHVSRFNSLEMMHDEVIREQKIKHVVDKAGKKVLTHQTLYLYLHQVEELVKANPTVRFYNFLSQGAKIQGAEDIASAEDLAVILTHEISKDITFSQQEEDVQLKNKILERV